MQKFFFSTTLSKLRSWLSDGNVELYSLDESFDDGILWKFTLAPSSNLDIKGSAQKIKDGRVIAFEMAETKAAINGNFLGVFDRPIEEMESFEFEFLTCNQVAFTLRVPDIRWKELQEFTCKCWRKGGIQVETSDISRERRVSNVYGLLSLDDENKLEDCAEILAKYFPKNLITWLSYCKSEEGWKRSWPEEA